MRQQDGHLSTDEIDVILRSRISEANDSQQVTGVLAEAREHLASCATCRSAMEMHLREEKRITSLRTILSVERGSECPPDIPWLQVAAGIVPRSLADKLVKHAAACDHCGPLLREALLDFEDELAPAEEMFLNQLESNNSEWQRQLALDICRSQPRQSFVAWLQQRFGHGSGLWRWAYGGAVAVFVSVIMLGLRLFQETPVDTLLATAYTQQRTIELRIPKAGYAPVRLTRSANQSRLDRPPALLEGEARIARELQHHPNNPTLLQAMGRADLLDWNYQAAIQTLTHALELAPSAPLLMIDLASAYFENAEVNQHRASDYSEALQLLDQALKLAPNDPVALFNRAIVYERMDLPDRAIEDWHRYLRVDPDSGWASEARNRLSRIERTNNKRQ